MESRIRKYRNSEKQQTYLHMARSMRSQTSNVGVFAYFLNCVFCGILCPLGFGWYLLGVVFSRILKILGCSSWFKGSTLANISYIAVTNNIAEWWKTPPNKKKKKKQQTQQRHHSNQFNMSRHRYHARSNAIILRIMCVAIAIHQHHAPSNGNILRIVCVARLLCVVEHVCFQCGWTWVVPSVEH